MGHGGRRVSIYTPATLSYDELFWHIHVEEMGNNLNLYAVFGDGDTIPAPQPVVTETPAASTEDNTPVVDTRTEQQKEIDEAIANGTWGIEYTTCQKCGYHNWTRQGNVYVCDTCGNTTTTVVGPKGVKGYVGSGAIAAVAPKASAPETRYATAPRHRPPLTSARPLTPPLWPRSRSRSTRRTPRIWPR